MRRQFVLMMIAVFSLSLASLSGCGPAAVNVSSASPPERGATPTTDATPSPAETPSGSESTEAQGTPPKAPATPEQPTRTTPGVTQPDRAQELLRQVREALGGEARLKEILSFSASGPFRRASGDQEQSGDKRLDLLLPDKFKISETLNLIAGLEITIVSALNGNQAWTDTQSSAGNAQVMMMRRRGNEQQNSEEQVKNLRADFTRYMVALFLMPPLNSSIEIVYGGEAEAADGRADILDLKGANGFVARLFVDKKTHIPLMMSYRDVVMPARTMKSAAGNRGDIDRIVKDAQANPPARQESDVQMHLSDYRAEKGILLPHLISLTVNAKPYEEWVVKNFKLNSPELTAQKFENSK